MLNQLAKEPNHIVNLGVRSTQGACEIDEAFHYFPILCKIAHAEPKSTQIFKLQSHTVNRLKMDFVSNLNIMLKM